MIRKVVLSDAQQITEIYNYYILNSIITLEETPVSVDTTKELIKSVITNLPWIVYEENRQVVGFAYANKWKSRSGYKHTVESTVYLKEEATGKGIGSLIYTTLIDQLISMKFHAIIGGISLPNEVSVALHERLGFEKIAHFKEVGFKFNKWVDVGYWQLISSNFKSNS